MLVTKVTAAFANNKMNAVGAMHAVARPCHQAAKNSSNACIQKKYVKKIV